MLRKTNGRICEVPHEMHRRLVGDDKRADCFLGAVIRDASFAGARQRFADEVAYVVGNERR